MALNDPKKISVAIIGDLGCGKSSFIKSAKALCGDEKGRIIMAINLKTPAPNKLKKHIKSKLWRRLDDSNADIAIPFEVILHEMNLPIIDAVDNTSDNLKIPFDVILLCFPSGDDKALEKLEEEWYRLFSFHHHIAPILLVGCKSDLDNTDSDASKMQNMISIHMCSGQTGEGIEDVVRTAILAHINKTAVPWAEKKICRIGGTGGAPVFLLVIVLAAFPLWFPPYLLCEWIGKQSTRRKIKKSIHVEEKEQALQ